MSLPRWPKNVRCDNCKHWTGTEDPRRGLCDLGTSRMGKPKDTRTTAFARDGEEWHADLVTDREHACNQWEPHQS